VAIVATRAFLGRVDGLLEAIERGAPSIGAERILTEGYAHALQLERELRRLEREMTQLATQAEEPQAARRLRRLALRISATREALDELRRRLGTFKDALAGQSV
jgi:hypothetical protein